MAGELWVDFKQVKATVSIEQVLGRYGLLDRLKRKGDQLTGPCPIHKGKSARSFSVNTGKNAFRCFSGKCGKSGNQIDLVAAIEGVEFRDAALLMRGWFGISPRNDAEDDGTSAPRESDATEREAVTSTSTEEKTRENPPLSFELKLEPHEYLDGRGLTGETAATFGLGFSKKGSMKGRIAIPIHNGDGSLVAYCGRWVGDDDPPEGEGKYKLPGTFRKSLEVFNLHRVPPGRKRVIVVEGFFSVFWLHQNGYPNVVSVMGSSISKAQARLLAANFEAVQVFFDGDDAGAEGGRKVMLELAELGLWVQKVRCPEALQPDRLPAHELKRLLS